MSTQLLATEAGNLIGKETFHIRYQNGGAKNLPGANIKMKTYLDCIPCFFRQALAAARMSTEDEIIQRRVLISVSNMIPDMASKV